MNMFETWSGDSEGTTMLAEGASLEVPGFRIEHYLGAWRFGTAYLATQLSVDRTVEIRVVSEALSRSPLQAARFMRGTLALSRLRHESLLEIIDMGEAGGRLYLVTEHPVGETLADRLSRVGTLRESEAVAVARQTADALRCAFAEGVVHGEIRPQYVLLMRGGTVKVTDFNHLSTAVTPDCGPDIAGLGEMLGRMTGGDRRLADGPADYDAVLALLREPAPAAHDRARRRPFKRVRPARSFPIGAALGAIALLVGLVLLAVL